MPFQRLRRAMLTAACVVSLVLAACGGGDVVSQFQPSRMVAFGDAFADLGQRGGARYTINDGGVNNWSQQLAARYGLSIAPTASGGTSYATGSARVTAKPDAAGNAATPTISEQITTFLGSQAPAEGDLVVVSGGIADVVAEVARVVSGQQSGAQATAAVRQAGTELGVQVRRLVNAGAKHVLVVGTYNLGRSPWAVATGQQTLLTDITNAFNDQLKISIVNLGANVLYVDAALFFNLVTAAPSAYGLSDVSNVACNSRDAGPGIGIGANQVNSSLCTSATLQPNAGAMLFADPVYFTPAPNVRFGDYAYDRLRDRF